MKWERIVIGGSTSHYSAIDERGREWTIEATYGGGRTIKCDNKYVTDVEPPQALAEAKRIAAEKAAA